MKILIIPPLTRKITSRVTAARPRIIFDLVSGLVKKGHKVSVLGTGNSIIPGVKIIPVIPKGFYETQRAFENKFYAHTAFLAKLAKILEKIAKDYDIIHNHSYPECIPLLVEKGIEKPILTTIHNLTMPKLVDETLSYFKKSYFICISNAQKKLLKKTKVYKVIYHGIDTELYKFHKKKEDYLLWIGRLSKAKDKRGRFLDPKGIRWAIKLAKETDSKLILAGNVEDPKFFKKDIKPYLNKKIKWITPVSSKQPLSKRQVAKLMQKAKAFLMTVNFPESFGLVIAESMSCGTPVIGFDQGGAVSELIINRKTGFIVKPKKGVEGLKKALEKIDQINPEDCRAHVEKNFSFKKMIDNYEKVYKEIISKK